MSRDDELVERPDHWQCPGWDVPQNERFHSSRYKTDKQREKPRGGDLICVATSCDVRTSLRWEFERTAVKCAGNKPRVNRGCVACGFKKAWLVRAEELVSVCEGLA